MSFIIVFLGAGIGGALRHNVNLIAAHLVGTSFPAGTMFINIVGSLAMAILAETFTPLWPLSSRGLWLTRLVLTAPP